MHEFPPAWRDDPERMHRVPSGRHIKSEANLPNRRDPNVYRDPSSRAYRADADPSEPSTITSNSGSCSRSISVASFVSVSSGCSESLNPDVVVAQLEDDVHDLRDVNLFITAEDLPECGLGLNGHPYHGGPSPSHGWGHGNPLRRRSSGAVHTHAHAGGLESALQDPHPASNPLRPRHGLESHSTTSATASAKTQPSPGVVANKAAADALWKPRRRVQQEEKLGRQMLEDMEGREFWSIQMLEEELFTKLPVLVIERAWCAYKTRCIIAEIIRQRRLRQGRDPQNQWSTTATTALAQALESRPLQEVVASQGCVTQTCPVCAQTLMLDMPAWDAHVEECLLTFG
mmetsp:Transcript_77722/g.137007  ORF Transcript_77722/g.137007 Transcript_77722/m.137007 type:complete len:344 (-) Transcript_77722:306-1337(-)